MAAYKSAVEQRGEEVTPEAQATAVRHQVVVDAPIERAFSVFTEDFGRFKAPAHNLGGGARGARLLIEVDATAVLE